MSTTRTMASEKSGTGRTIPAVVVFAIFWMGLLLLYLPAARAGWVSDTLGWLEAVRRQSFQDFIARKGFKVPSHYQTTQTVTWLLYRIFGADRWAWHLIQLSLHALNATLLFTLLGGILRDCRLERARICAFGAAALFCTSPYVSEVVVWEAAFHFLQGLLFILLQLLLLRSFLHHSRVIVAIVSLVLYGVSLFSLELFYLVPVLGGLTCLFYHHALSWEPVRVWQAWRYIVIPQSGILLLYFIGIFCFTGASTGRLGNEWMQMPITAYLVKPPEYFFHLLWGRFLPQGWRTAVYNVCSSYLGAGIFYAGLAVLTAYIIMRYRKLGRHAQIAGFFFLWLLLATMLVSPLWFPQRLLIVGDRYLYVLLPPFFALVSVGVARLIRHPEYCRGILTALIIFNLPLTLGLNRTWNESEVLTDKLQKGLTDAPGKITILLNSPAALRGAYMTGAGSDGEVRLMHELFYGGAFSAPVLEAPAQNLLLATDTIRIEQLDAQSLKVILTKPGAFWQYSSDVARSFYTDQFAVVVHHPDCCYTLRLLKPAAQYRLLYQKSGRWYQFNLLAK